MFGAFQAANAPKRVSAVIPIVIRGARMGRCQKYIIILPIMPETAAFLYLQATGLHDREYIRILQTR
jgi:hypothetical protein